MGPMGAGPVVGGGMRGASITFARQNTSKRVLEVKWDFPVYTPPEQPKGQQSEHTVAAQVAEALPEEQAFAWISRTDKRPLLVLRECDSCKGTDDALLSRSMNNDETRMLLRWFHCVKLPVHVMKAGHPFHQLFDGEHPPHLFLCDPDGGSAATFDGGQTQSGLKQVMYEMLKRHYTKDPRQAIREMHKLLSHYDHLDSREVEIRERLDNEIERNGPKSPKVAEIERDLAEIDKQRKAAKAKEQQLCDLGLKAGS